MINDYSKIMEFRVGVIRPVECFREGWDLIKNRYWLIFGITIVGMLIGGFVPLGVALGAMMCGIYYSIFKLMDGKQVEFSDLFKGFEYFLPGLIVALVLFVPTFVVSIALQVVNFAFFAALQANKDNPAAIQSYFIVFFSVFSVAMLAFGLFIACIHALIMFAFPLIVERKMKGWDAFKLSSRAVWANLSGVAGIIALEFLLSLLGLLVCYFGVLLVMPIFYAAVAVAYRKVFPPLAADFDSNLPPPPPVFVNESGWQ